MDAIGAAFAACCTAAAAFAVPGLADLLGDHPGRAAARPAGRPAVVAYADAATERRAGRAVEGLPWPWAERLPGWRIELEPGEGPVAGYTWSAERRIEVFVRDGVDVAHLRRVLAHELGHAVDLTYLTAEDRRAWEELRGIVDEPWWPESGARDFATGAGDFAECFAVWLVGGELFRSELGPPPGPAERRFLAEVAARGG